MWFSAYFKALTPIVKLASCCVLTEVCRGNFYMLIDDHLSPPLAVPLVVVFICVDSQSDASKPDSAFLLVSLWFRRATAVTRRVRRRTA